MLAGVTGSRLTLTQASPYSRSPFALTPMCCSHMKWWKDLTDHGNTGSSFAKRFSYVADDFFSNFAGAKPLSLAALAVMLIFVGSVFLYRFFALRMHC